MNQVEQSQLNEKETFLSATSNLYSLQTILYGMDLNQLNAIWRRVNKAIDKEVNRQAEIAHRASEKVQKVNAFIGAMLEQGYSIEDIQQAIEYMKQSKRTTQKHVEVKFNDSIFCIPVSGRVSELVTEYIRSTGLSRSKFIAKYRTDKKQQNEH